jgi:hypothetical protein
MRQSLAIERGEGSGNTIHWAAPHTRHDDTVTPTDPVNLRDTLAR